MITRRQIARWVLAFVLSLAVLPPIGSAFAHVAVGDVIDNEELATLDGGKAPLFSPKALANVLIFFRPQQEHSLSALRQMAQCEQEFAGRPVRFVAIVSSSWPPDEVKAVIAETGVKMPVLVDAEDHLYGKLGVRLHPTIGIVNEKRELVAYEPFKKINYCDRVRGKIRYALHEIDLAEVQRSENPPRALFPNEIKGAVSNRHVKMGERFLQARQYDKAAREAKGVIEKEPDFAPAHVLLGDTLAAQGRCADALPAYDAALKLDPSNKAATKGKQACGGR